MKVKLMMATACLAVVYGGIAFAADWNFYGSARVETFWTDSDINDTTNLSESLQSNSRIGARVRASDELTGRFEYGASGGDANVRILYGEWDFGAGTLLVGQDWTPLYLPLSNQVYNTDNGLGGWGEASPGRHTMIRLKFDGFEIAAISPDNTYFKSNGDAVVDSSDISSGNTQTAFPRIEVSYKVDMDKLSLAVGGGYNTFEYNDDQDIDAYVGVIRAAFRTGPASFGVQGFAGRNVGNIISTDTTGDELGNGYAKVNGNRVIDNDALGCEVVAAVMVNESVTIEAGFGYVETEYDDESSEDVIAYYLQAPVTMASGVVIVPEIGVIDYQEDSQDEITYFGAKWQITF